MHFHLHRLEKQIPNESDEHDEKFYQVAARLPLATVEHWYSGKQLDSLLTNLCWNLLKENKMKFKKHFEMAKIGIKMKNS